MAASGDNQVNNATKMKQFVYQLMGWIQNAEYGLLWYITGYQSLLNNLCQCRIGKMSLFATTEYAGITTLEAKCCRIHCHIRTGFINHGNRTKRYGCLYDFQAVRQYTVTDSPARWIREGHNLSYPFRNGDNPLHSQSKSFLHG